MSIDATKLNELFSAALALPGARERERYLSEACGGDLDLRKQLDSLVLSYEQSEQFLQKPVIRAVPVQAAEVTGAFVGRYKLLEQIGEGGFGVVFMAEQREPVRRLVALKVIKAGMDTKEVVARFDAERQALALMDHPNIARVLDGGTTASGRPYFVMDLVKGTPITEFCDLNQLSLGARVKLFLQVCAGVQHAHQKGIIHRDLKPTNVLVTVHDGVQVPKVIDFGVAKAIGQKLTDHTLFTRFAQLIGTPAYMSPEQAEWGATDIDTRSDIYSLGALLYELLTSTTPFEKERLAAAAFDEVRRIVRETEPATPSTRLQGLGRRLNDVAKERQVEPSMLASRVRGDLDWIVMKALEKDRNRRYDTATALAGDLERHLSGEPVLACPPSKIYRFAKFVRRNRVAVTLGTTVGLAILVGLVLSLVGFTRARAERENARAAAAMADAIADFFSYDVLLKASPFESPKPDITLKEVLDQAAASLDGRFAKDPVTEAKIRIVLAETYRGLASYEVAERHAKRVLEILSDPRVHVRDLQERRLEAEARLGQIHLQQGRTAEAQRSLEQTLNEARRLLGDKHQLTTDIKRLLAKASVFVSTPKDLDKAESLLRQTADLPDDGFQTLDLRAAMLRLAGRWAEAAEANEQLLDLVRHKLPPQHPNRVAVLASVAEISTWTRNWQRSRELFREALLLQRKINPQHGYTAAIETDLHGVEASLGNWQECLALCRTAVDKAGEAETKRKLAYDGALASLLVGDTISYRDFVDRTLKMTFGTTNAEAACRAGEVTFLRPDSSTNMQLAFQFAESGVDWLPTRSQVALAMAEFRRGNFGKALQCLESAPHSEESFIAGQSGYLRAMIYHRQGRTNEAVAECRLAAEKVPALTQTGFMVEDWQDYARVAVTRAEAEQMIFGEQESKLVTPEELTAARAKWQPVHQHLSAAAKFGGLQQWENARREYLTGIEQPRFNWEHVEFFIAWQTRIALPLLFQKDFTNHARLCREWYHFLETHPDGYIARDTITASLICQTPFTDSFVSLAGPWVAEARRVQAEGALAWAMYSYRARNFSDVLAACDAAGSSNRAALREGARIFKSMALAKLGRQAEAQRELQAAEKILQPLIASRIGDYWWDISLCQLGLEEAHQLVGPAAVAASDSNPSR
jgi:tetratricopeptide (TPR) repeat protein